MRLDPELREVRVEDRLVEDVAVAKLAAAGFAPPLYLHATVKLRSHRPAHTSQTQGSATGVGIMESLGQAFSLGQQSFKSFGLASIEAPPIQAFITEVCHDLGIPPPTIGSLDNAGQQQQVRQLGKGFGPFLTRFLDFPLCATPHAPCDIIC